jgi:hypothetical protein
MKRKTVNSQPDDEKLPAIEKKPPLAWARELCAGVRPVNGAPFYGCASAEYQVASQLYGWARQVYHFGEDSFELSELEFRAALESAVKFPVAAPLQAAIPPVSKDKFKKFTTKKAK